LARPLPTFRTLTLVTLATTAIVGLSGCAVGFGQLGAGSGGRGAAEPYGVLFGATAGADEETFGGFRDTTNRYASHAHVDAAWNLPGDVLSVGGSLQHYQREFDGLEPKLKYTGTGYGPMVWLKLFPTVNVDAAALRTTGHFEAPDVVGGSFGKPQVDGTRYQVDLSYIKLAGEQGFKTGFRVGYHWTRTEKAEIGGLQREFRSEGPYGEMVVMFH
jgi:hypothetical protein